MNRRHRRLQALAILALLITAPAATPPENANAGRPKGSLVIVGGGSRSEAMMRRFVELAGGPGRARVAVLPMASSEAAESGAELPAEARHASRPARPDARRLHRAPTPS